MSYRFSSVSTAPCVLWIATGDTSVMFESMARNPYHAGVRYLLQSPALTQLLLTPRDVYVLVLDVTKPLSEPVQLTLTDSDTTTVGGE